MIANFDLFETERDSWYAVANLLRQMIIIYSFFVFTLEKM